MNWRLGSDRRCEPQTNRLIHNLMPHLLSGSTETFCQERLIIRKVSTALMLRILVFLDLKMNNGVNGTQLLGTT